jgi:multisubunit Na+/H+ antiporter MnhC subunit
MSTTRKIVIGLGIAGGAALAAWLLTGSRKQKTKEFIAKGAQTLKNSLNKDDKTKSDPSDIHYV